MLTMKTKKNSPIATRVAVFPTGLGWMAAAWRLDRLSRLTFGHGTAREALRAVPISDELADRLIGDDPEFAQRMAAFADGAVDDFRDLAIVESDYTDFQRRIVRACRRIPYGCTSSYGELAAKAGSPRAARAVGNVMANNPVALVVPCHRVVGSGGALGGYSAPNGLRMKRRLLALEAARSPQVSR